MSGDQAITVAVKGYQTFFTNKNLPGIVWDETLTVAVKPDLNSASTQADGTFAVEGIPGDCTHGVLISYQDSLAVNLSGAVTQVTYSPYYPSLGLKPPLRAKPTRSSWRGWFQGFDLLGKRRPGRVKGNSD